MVHLSDGRIWVWLNHWTQIHLWGCQIMNCASSLQTHVALRCCQCSGITHDGVRLACNCLAMKTRFMKLRTQSLCAHVASRGSLKHCRVMKQIIGMYMCVYQHLGHWLYCQPSGTELRFFSINNLHVSVIHYLRIGEAKKGLDMI